MGAVNIRYRHLEFHQSGPVATLKLNRPDTGNGIDTSMATEFREVCRETNEDESIRLLVLTGSGDTFSVGRQILPDDGFTDAPDGLSDRIKSLQVASCLAGLRVPVIAAINGDALDHGLELALAADIRIAAAGVRLGLTGLGQGQFPWDGGTQRLPRIVGSAWAQDMILTGRAVEASEALSIGLVNRVSPREELADQVRQLTSEILSAAPIATEYAKEAVRLGMDLSLSQGLRLEADLNILLHSTSDRAEGLRSFMERRKPEFGGT